MDYSLFYGHKRFFVDGNDSFGSRIVLYGSDISLSGEIDIVSKIVEAVHFAAIVFEQITDFVRGIVSGRFVLQRNSSITRGNSYKSEQKDE